MAKNYVMHSTEESRERRIASVLAIVETVFLVFLTWFIAVHFNTYTHIYVAIAIAPFLLLKTPQSTQKAIELFQYKHKFKENIFKYPIFWLFVFTILIVDFIVSYYLAANWLIHYSSWGLFFRSIVVGLFIANMTLGLLVVTLEGVGKSADGLVEGMIVGCLSGTVAGGTVVGGGIAGGGIAVGIVAGGFIGGFGGKRLKGGGEIIVAEGLVGIVELGAVIVGAIGLMGFVALGLLLRAFTIKILVTTFYTLKHPIKAILSLPVNWREQIFVNDTFYTPELLPDIYKTNARFQLSGLHNFSNNRIDKFFAYLITPIWALGYLYRFSIKSTAWFFFPLAYLSNLEALQSRNRQKKILALQIFKNYWIFNLFILAIVLIYFDIISKIPMPKQIDWIFEYSNQISLFLHEHIVDGSIWLIVISLILYLMINLVLSAKKHFESNNIDNPSVIPDKLVHWMIRLTFILWMVFLGWNLVVITNHELMPKVAELISS